MTIYYFINNIRHTERETYQLNHKNLTNSFKNLARAAALAAVLNSCALPGNETQIPQEIPTHSPDTTIIFPAEIASADVLAKININIPKPDLKSADDILPKPKIISAEHFTSSTQILPPDVLEQLKKPKPETSASPAVNPQTSESLPLQKTYSKNLYDTGSVLYQNPDMTACVPTSTEIMLNLIAKKGTSGNGFIWSPDASYQTMEKIFTFEKANDTLATASAGSDPNGWRNGLNKYGWGSYEDPNQMIYKVEAFKTYEQAVKAIVKAIALFNKPVGILGWGGSHAQIINGYKTSGQDPATSDSYTVVELYLTDPLQGDGMRNAAISNAQFKSGSTAYRFQPYVWTDSPYDDPYTPGITEAYKDWYGKFVIVAPVR